jgi:hypothetical protein
VYFIFNTKQILGKEMPHATFQVETDLDLKSYSSAVPAPPTPTPGTLREQPVYLTIKGWESLTRFLVEMPRAFISERLSLFIVNIIVPTTAHSLDSKRVSWNYWIEEIRPAPNPQCSCGSKFTALSKVSGLLPQPPD